MKAVQRLLAVGAIVAFTGGAAYATDQLVTGKKLLIKNLPSGDKLVFLSKDPSIVIGAAGSAEDPQCAATGATVVKDGSDNQTYLAKNSNAPASCNASPSGAFLDPSL